MATTKRLDPYHFYEEDWESFEALREAFEWEVPDEFNIAAYVCDRWAEKRGRTAVFGETPDGDETVYTFWQLQREANRLANYLARQGVSKGERVGINLNQRPVTLVAHLACWKLGAVSVPLSLLFGRDAMEYRLNDCDAVACIVEETNVDSLRTAETPSLETVVTVGVDEVEESETSYETAIEDETSTFETVETDAEDDAIIIYTSGTTGPPKGVLHAHRFLIGHLPASAEWFLSTGSSDEHLFWTPVEWSWIGSLFSVVMPALFYGQPVVAYAGGKFDARDAFRIVEKYGVTSFTAPPTALRMMRQVEDPNYDLAAVRRVGSGGESISRSLREWAAETFGVDTIEGGYGQTEVNVIVTDCPELAGVKQGKLGVVPPGHEVAILDRNTRERLGPSEVGEIAVRYEGDPVCFVEYWNEPEKTEGKIQDGWVLTEDIGTVDEEGYFEFIGRKDDVIISSGYKIGPEEVEEALMGHESVAAAGVIGVPDEERGQIPKAFVVPDASIGENLREELQTHVKDRLASYEYPREIEFVDDLPRTSTEKVRRKELRKREGLVDD